MLNSVTDEDNSRVGALVRRASEKLGKLANAKTKWQQITVVSGLGENDGCGALLDSATHLLRRGADGVEGCSQSRRQECRRVIHRHHRADDY